jgi:hypothetical protein
MRLTAMQKRQIKQTQDNDVWQLMNQCKRNKVNKQIKGGI